MARELTQADRLELAAMRRAADGCIARAVATAGEGKTPGEINDLTLAIREWKPGTYQRYDVRIDPADGIPYWALHNHDSAFAPDQRPSATPTMWAHYHGTSPETARPFVSEGHNMYYMGHYCTEGGGVYRCTVGNTIYAPSVLPGAWERVG